MRAAIIAVGTEMLGTTRLDTNSLLLTRTLEQFGVRVARKSVVADDADAIAAEILHSLEAAGTLLITGGLGPTEDDVTREGVASALGLRLVRDDTILQRIEGLFARRGLKMPSVNERQAMVFDGHKVIVNPRGTAPGFHLNLTWKSLPKHVWIFPGVPYELEGMVESELQEWLEKTRQQSVFRRVVKITGMTESAAEEKLQPFYARRGGEPVTILAHRGEIHLHLHAVGTADEAYPRLTAMEQELRDIFGDRVFGLDEEVLEAVVGRLLTERGETIATAESCTGGLLASRITDVSGSSVYFMGGAVAYSQQAKLSLLGVEPAVVQRQGEVSEEVAIAMASGARSRFSTTYGIGITGIAGPTGGTAAKPVGTVFIAVSSEAQTASRSFYFRGPRELIKHLSTQAALDMVRMMVLRG